MKACVEIRTDETLQELAQHGTADFPLQCYCDRTGVCTSGCFPWHWHREMELVYVESGDLLCLVGSERIALSAGEGVFVNSGVIHSFESPGGVVLPNILFLPEFIAPEHSAIYRKYVAPFLEGTLACCALRKQTPWQADVLAQMQRITAAYEQSTPTRELDLHAMLSGLWAQLYLHRAQIIPLRRAGGATLMQARLRRMIAYIQTHYAQRLTLEALARDANISVSEVLRCFKEGLRTTPIGYLTQYRLTVARRRLLTTTTPVSEIAIACGFSSVNYFDRVFSRAFGVTPLWFRKRREA